MSPSCHLIMSSSCHQVKKLMEEQAAQQARRSAFPHLRPAPLCLCTSPAPPAALHAGADLVA
jgi:hypothetical protein